MPGKDFPSIHSFPIPTSSSGWLAAILVSACSESHHHLPLTSLSSSLCYSLCPRKCWTSARTEEAVKSSSTAVSSGPTSALAAANTSLSGTNADPVSVSTALRLHFRLRHCPNLRPRPKYSSKTMQRKSTLLVSRPLKFRALSGLFEHPRMNLWPQSNQFGTMQCLRLIDYNHCLPGDVNVWEINLIREQASQHNLLLRK